MSLKEPNSRLVRWRLRLEEFDYEIEYKKGPANTIADALSRIEIHTKELSDFYLQSFDENFLEIPQNNNNDDDNLSLIVNTGDDQSLHDNNEDNNNDNDEDSNTVHSSNEEPILGMKISEKCLNSFDHQIIIDFVMHSAAKPKSEKIFETKKRLWVQISENSIEEDTINLFKNYVDPKFTYAVYFTNEKQITKILESRYRVAT